MGNDILEMYLYEMNTLLEQLDDIVLSAEKNENFSQEDINEIFRIMHTIKGSSAMMEFNSLMTVAHRIEDLFFVIREENMESIPDDYRSDMFDMIFHSVDFFRAEIGKIENNESLTQNIDNFLQNINSFSQKIKPSHDDVPAKVVHNLVVTEEECVTEEPIPLGEECLFAGMDYPYVLHVSFDEGCGMENLRAFMLVSSLRDFCGDEDLTFYPADVESNSSTSDFIVEKGFFLAFRNESDRSRAIPVVTNSGSLRAYQTIEAATLLAKNQKAHPAAPGAEQSAATPVEKVSAPEQDTQVAAKQTTVSKESLISVNLSKLDQLMAVVGEIVITESMVTASPDLKGLKLDGFNQAARQLRSLTDELQDISMSLRMVPVSGTFQKMNRIVRDMGKKLGKQVDLILVGEDTEVDKTIVDSISDPIMHIVRNSMDHGIEEHVQDRLDAGKSARGQIILSARHTGSEVIIEVKDDGAGVNCDAVLAKAQRQGLALPGVDYSQREILNFLLMPGFSTNTEVTEFSGRGVGMDVVKSNVESVGGTISLSSERGKGMTTTLKIPLTMAIMDGMEVSVGSSIFTIPINNIRQIFKVSSQDVIYDAVRGEMIKCMDSFYSIIRTKELYRLQEGYDHVDEGILLWVESSENSYCLFVDELIGEQQVVVKPLPAYVNNFGIKNHGITGCTILGDGNISIILDIANIYLAAQGE